jgi:hypothetical protein
MQPNQPSPKVIGLIALLKAAHRLPWPQYLSLKQLEEFLSTPEEFTPEATARVETEYNRRLSREAIAEVEEYDS